MATIGTLRRLSQTKPRSLKAAYYYVKPKEKRGPSGQAWLALAGVTATLVGTGIYFLGRPEEEIEGLGSQESSKYANKPVVKAYLYRAWDSVIDFRKRFSDPSSEKLLPDFLPPPYQRPYTLVLEMNDVLLHTSYDRQSGWKYQKRPGVDDFLLQLVDFYELVVFTSETAISGNSLLAALDPNQLILYKLYRDSTNYTDGVHVKDLTNLNRPLTRVIIVDTDSKSVRFHPENSIILKKWTGEVQDQTLKDLVAFLQTIALHNVEDVRPVLDYYKSERGEDKVLETFLIKQAELRLQEEQSRQMMEQQGTQRGLGGITTFSLRRPVQQQQVTPPPSSPEVPPPVTVTEAPIAQSSWTDWVGSWIGWK